VAYVNALPRCYVAYRRLILGAMWVNLGGLC
jgi:hypothetical protein